MGDDREYGKAYPVAKAVVKPTMKLLWRVHPTGLHHVPTEGPAILCPNHISFFDSLVLPCVLPRRISYVGKAEYLDSWKTRYVFPAIGMIPIDRTGGSAAQRALDTAARVLGRGELFGIYPEGTRSRDGYLHRGRTGAARLALRTGAPLIPVGIRGTDLMQPTGAKFPKPFTACQVNIGAPIHVTRYLDREGDRMLLRQLTDEVMFEVAKLSGQTYVDVYAGKKLPEEVAPTNGAPDGATDPEPETAETPARDRDRQPVAVGADGDTSDVEIDVRQSSADVLARWWS